MVAPQMLNITKISNGRASTITSLFSQVTYIYILFLTPRTSIKTCGRDLRYIRPIHDSNFLDQGWDQSPL